MAYTTNLGRELSAGGMEFDKGSVYELLGQLRDRRSRHGKGYELEGVLAIVLLAKMFGADKPMGIAERECLVRPLFQIFQICEVLMSTCSFLVFLEILKINKIDRNAVYINCSM